jgi:NAD(P)H-flavin reductase
MNIKQTTGIVTSIRDLSATAREYTITPSEPFPFIAGAFVNLFIEHQGKTIRRAFSMSSNDKEDRSFTLSIRLSPGGELTPLLWEEDFLGREVRLMGPLGLNTADKMHSDRVFLFGFGIGAGVVKSLAEHFVEKESVSSVTVVTGNRSATEILHKDFFDTLAQNNEKAEIAYVLSDRSQTDFRTGYIQDNLTGYDFNNADVYMCGQGVACEALEAEIRRLQPQNCNFFVEDFH